jgi:sec-independent protein translocase protein TatB
VFGFSFGEIVVLLIVGIVVVGPRKLPAMMRTAGQWVTRLRRMATDLRSQSGIDELIRIEGLEREVAELRALSRMNVVDSFIAPALAATAPQATSSAAPARIPDPPRIEPLREREYPLVGCDAYDALADDAAPYPPRIVPPDAPTVPANPPGAMDMDHSGSTPAEDVVPDAPLEGMGAEPGKPGEPQSSSEERAAS